MQELRPITVAYGDGIGPEIMDATLKILSAAGARIKPEFIEIGEKVYLSGNSAGIEPGAWDSLRRTKVFLKSPITTPQGGGYKSLNVTTRKMLGLYANIRPCVAYPPYIETKFPKMDVVIVRENEEDLYAGIEHQQTPEVVQCLKLITLPGTEKIIRYAFEYARQYGRKKVTCFTKDNIMKQTDGLFHKIYNEIGEEYPEIQKEHWIIDIGTAKLADRPEQFDVIVLPNLYGDILSDVAAEIAGSVGLGGSANIGEEVAMFEAIHGSAPDIAGKNIANPSGLLLGAVQMLVHIEQPDVAEKIHNAWLKTIEDGYHTGDIYQEGLSVKKVGTKEFADCVVERLGQKPAHFKAVDYSAAKKSIQVVLKERQKPVMETIGIDIFLYHEDRNAETLGKALEAITVGDLHLTMITNRGVKVYPGGMRETFCTDHWRCRYKGNGSNVAFEDFLALQQKIAEAGFHIIKTESLCTFDGKEGFSAGQGA